jgi:hypothetical protein
MKTQSILTDGYRPHLFLRLYAEVYTDAEASQLAQTFVSCLQICAPVVLRKISPYWKIPAYYGFEFDFVLDHRHDEVFDCLINLSPRGWSIMGSPPARSAVWNPSEGAILLTGQVRWANVELH